MSNDNYPAGVTDAHPYFNPQEGSVNVTCGADEALVVPSFAVKMALVQLLHDAEEGNKAAVTRGIAELNATINEIERDGSYDCQFEDVMDVDISEEAHWDCPRCGNERVSDTIPEDRDPDEGWDSRFED